MIFNFKPFHSILRESKIIINGKFDFFDAYIYKIECMRKQVLPLDFDLSQKREVKPLKKFHLLRRKPLPRGKSIFWDFALVNKWKLNGKKWPDNCVFANETQLCPHRTKSNLES